MSAHDAKGAGSTRLVGIVFPKDGQADAPGRGDGFSDMHSALSLP
jgi:hypothetical protein